MKDPLGIDIMNPRFSWELSSTGKNKKQKNYQILVSTEVSDLNENKGSVWNSKEVADNNSNQITYKGKPLKTNTLYFWKVCIWDEKGRSSGWSRAARFLVGPLKTSDWRGQWIGEKEVPVSIDDKYYSYEGYMSSQSSEPDQRKWVVIDLGAVQRVDAIKIYPIAKKELLFPKRFTLEVAASSDFSDAEIVAD
jgi:alpha-L-rhamnosidase